MANSNTQKTFKWEWPADRVVQIRLLATITKIAKQKEGLFGINKSPSIAANLPDATIVSGKIIDGDTGYVNKTFTLTLPKLELGDIAINDNVALGVINSDICICIAKAPKSESGKKQTEWLNNWQCTK